jgi:hypothetical protein
MISMTAFSQSLSVSNLRCEYKKDPIGIDIPKPKFSWELQSDQKNILQSAFRVLIADDPALLQKNTGNIWDSKKIILGNSIQVAYQGSPLRANKKYFWKVMVWDNKGQSSSWSDQATWQMGLLSASDWEEPNGSAMMK